MQDLTGTLSAAVLLMHEFGHVKQDIEAEQFAALGPLAGAGGIRDFTAWLNGLHARLLPMYGYAGLVAPNLPNPHNDVMEDDNVTRHERPAQIALGEPIRNHYHNTLIFDDLNPQTQMIVNGMGLDPAMPAHHLPAMVSTAFKIRHAPLPVNTNSVLEVDSILINGRA
ncbi:hypothetical protein G6O69_11245 [Pseudenhygromyxa sp. WMMC2535]|uniref:hypothetical protein n=1 Tax=Pseudenhygromyxa sp. WMMC2535 TaxID=2712867 RepID=UPI00155279F4|nr:hypothetical protein [Pseudenhygromyxa sp. WMMC2535]NVB38407.1 hypothetical protein [Pseudenhygromyxa sp. WMMC2535]